MAILPSAFDLPAGRLVALDLGHARTGVAVCDPEGLLASPRGVLKRHPTRAQDYAEIAALVARERAAGVLVGLPLNSAPVNSDAPADSAAAGAPQQARWVRRYAGRLAAHLPVPVAFWDESLSTVDALARLAEAHGRTPIDAAAAAVLLEDFLRCRRFASADANSAVCAVDPFAP